MSASAAKNLPSEITEAILCRLPAKSLGRFKSVSKTWDSLISDPQFIKTHLHHIIHRQITTKVIIVSYTKSLYSIEINELPSCLNSDDISSTGKEVSFQSSPTKWEDMLGSCNGLVLAKDENDTIFLMNPTTRELCNIPLSPFTLPPGKSGVLYGFGYDSSTDDYKVLSIPYWYKDNPDSIDMFISVYSLRNNSWKQLPDSPYDHHVTPQKKGVLVNQKLHYIARRLGRYPLLIVAFSLENEEFKEIELPNSIANYNYSYCELQLVDLGGKLGMFGTPPAGDYDLWVMEEYGVGESWTRVRIHGLQIGPFEPLCLVQGSNKDIVFYDICDEFSFLVYNTDERRDRDVRIEGGPTEFIVGGTYVETLESLKRLTTPP